MSVRNLSILLVSVLLFACGSSEPSSELPAPEAQPAERLSFGLLVDGAASEADLVEFVTHVVEQMIERREESRLWFAETGLHVRVIEESESMTEVPELVALDGKWGPIPEAYGLTVPEPLDGMWFLVAKRSYWFEQTLIHELTHVIAFAGQETDFTKEMTDAYYHRTVDVEGSAANPHENLAYKAQHFLSCNGAFLAEREDPTLSVLRRLYGEPLFPEFHQTSSELLEAYGFSDFVTDGCS